MITPYLEKMIHEGRAAFRNYPCALAGVYRMDIPANHYIVIHDIYFNDFNDSGDSLAFADWNSRVNQRLYISSTNGNSLHLLHRSSLHGVRFGLTDFLISYGCKQYEVYSIHAGTLKVAVSILPDNFDMVVPDYTPPPVIAQEEPVDSMGYGRPGFGANNANRVVIAAPFAREYQPLTRLYTGAAVQPNLEKYTPPVTALSNVPFGTQNANTGLPLFNICYTEVFEPLPERMKF